MSSTYSAQGSIRITRLRTGDSLLATLHSDKPLFQGVTDSTTVAPDWTDPQNQPTITPEVYSSRNGSVTIGAFTWYYNGTPVQFGSAAADGWATELANSTANPGPARFKVCVNPAAGETAGMLKIIGNLASNNNMDNDILKFETTVETGGVRSTAGASIDVLIQPMGASAYQGLVTVSPSNTFTDKVTDITLTPSLIMGAAPVGGYTVEWYHDSVADGNKVAKGINGNVLTVNRDDVGAQELYIAVFYVGGTEVSRYGVTLTDTTDEFYIKIEVFNADTNTLTASTIASANDRLKLVASVVDKTGNPVSVPASASWMGRVMNHDTWKQLRSVQDNEVIVTSADTDSGGEQCDVTVTFEVEW